MPLSSTGSQPLNDLAEQVGLFTQYWGFKKVHGKLWTLIYLSKPPVDANFLIDNLQISKALVSVTLKELISYGVICEVKKQSPGTQKYVANTNIIEAVVKVLKNRESQMLLAAKKSHTRLKKDLDFQNPDSLCPDKTDQVGQMIDAAQFFLEAFITSKSSDVTNLLQALSEPNK